MSMLGPNQGGGQKNALFRNREQTKDDLVVELRALVKGCNNFDEFKRRVLKEWRSTTVPPEE